MQVFVGEKNLYCFYQLEIWQRYHIACFLRPTSREISLPYASLQFHLFFLKKKILRSFYMLKSNFKLLVKEMKIFIKRKIMRKTLNSLP